MQIHRLFGIVYLLQNQKTMTAKQLAEKFEVSVRTILRDIETLSSVGIPIYTSQGKGGGISILEHFILDKTTLSDEEQNQILFALQSVVPPGQISHGPTLSKLRALFQKEDTSWIEVDFSRWGNLPFDHERFELLKKAIIQKQAVSFAYANGYGQNRSRKAYPLRMVFKSKAWYLQAFCLTRKDYRTFKMNRITSLHLLPEHFFDQSFSPPPIELPEQIPAHCSLSLLLHFSPQLAYRVYDEFDPSQISKEVDGSFLVRIQVPEDHWLYSFLLSFGADLKVIEPEHIKIRLLAMLDKMSAVYTASDHKDEASK